MSDLLAASMIEIDRRHLTSEIVPRIEAALVRLEEMGIIGKQLCLTPVDKTQTRWAKDWLTAKWEILPPLELLQAYQEVSAPKRRRRKARPKDITPKEIVPKELF